MRFWARTSACRIGARPDTACPRKPSGNTPAGRELGTRYSSGNDERDLIRHAWFGEPYEKGTHPVALKRPNAWGLFDMHGNVGEWCWDWYDRTYYNSSSKTDPRGAAKGDRRVYRGGGFDHPVANLQSADRTAKEPTLRYGGLGFRVVPEFQQTCGGVSTGGSAGSRLNGR